MIHAQQQRRHTLVAVAFFTARKIILNFSAETPVNVLTNLLLSRWSLIRHYFISIAAEANQPIIASCDYYSTPLGNGGTAPPPLPSF